MQKETYSVDILIPVYNEQNNILPLYTKICEAVKTIDNYKFQIFFINDGSTDATLKNILKLKSNGKNYLKYNCINLKNNSGKTQAFTNGISKCKGDLIITLDGDLQDDPTYIKNFIKRFREGNFDMVVGNRTNRYDRNIPKKISSVIANITARLLTGIKIHDMNCGFKLMTLKCASSLNLKSDYHRYMPLIASMEGFCVGEVSIEQKKRHSGESKYGKTGFNRFFSSLLDMLIISFVYKFRKEPFRLFGKAGILMFVMGCAIMFYLVIRWFFGHYIYGRPLFFISILLLILGFNIISMGFLGELIVINQKSNTKD